MNEHDIEWYAASNAIARMGPYDDQVKAWEALRRTPTVLDASVHVPGARVWPERKVKP